MFEDKTLVCRDCGKEFVFTASEQAFYAEKGFQNKPKTCRACRDARKNGAEKAEKPAGFKVAESDEKAETEE